MKTFGQNKLVLGVLCFATGALSLYAVQSLVFKKHRAETRSLNPFFDHFYSNDFFGKSIDPFEDMRSMRRQIMKSFPGPSEESGLFDSWYSKKFGGGSVDEIKKREDDSFVYYDIYIAGVDQNNVKVSVSNGQMEVSGKTEKKTTQDNLSDYSVSSFHRSIPVPSNVDSLKVQIENDKDKIIVKFPKLNS